MNLQCRVELGAKYRAATQIARIVSEDWCGRELYCAACVSDHLSSAMVNSPAIDLVCSLCTQTFQLKSSRVWNQKKIVDAAYDSMIRAIRSERVPNLLVMQYSSTWAVKNLMLIPSVFFTETVIEKRPPLGPHARRAGWVGCNILLDRIPEDGKIPIVSEGLATAPAQVRQDFSRVRRLAQIPLALRGWALDVLTILRKLGKIRFSLRELYAFESHFQNLHPKNRNVRPKIRQQLQVLRDLGIVRFSGPGNYEILS
jgi:type II restriction enzyme